jgi:hypothetical protein
VGVNMKWCNKPLEYRIDNCDSPCLVCLPKLPLQEGEKDISGFSCCGSFTYGGKGLPFRCGLGEDGIDGCCYPCVTFSEHDYQDWVTRYKEWDENGFYVCKYLKRTRKVRN